MRVRGEYGFNSAPSPCGSLSWGGTVDFTLKVVAAPVCTDPSALSVANITNTSANLGWTENGTATTWNIEYGATGFTQGSGTAINGTTTNPHALSGLTPNTNYEFYVQADCGSIESTWSGPFTFTTTSCLVTGQNGVMDVCELQDTVNLNSVIVMPSYPGTWVYAPVPSYIVNDTMFVISSLTPGAYLVNYVVTGLCPETIVAKIIIGKINNAGNDTAVTVCLNQPLNLQTLLSSGADANGTWLNPAGGTMTSSNITTSDTAGVFEYSYELSIGTCPDNVAVMTITVDADCDYLSVTQETMSDISVYPNPATTTLTILNPSNTSSLSVEMLDMNGRVVLVETKALNNATEGTLAIDHLEKGIYTLRIYKDGGQKIYKIVKQ